MKKFDPETFGPLLGGTARAWRMKLDQRLKPMGLREWKWRRWVPPERLRATTFGIWKNVLGANAFISLGAGSLYCSSSFSFVRSPFGTRNRRHRQFVPFWLRR